VVAGLRADGTPAPYLPDDQLARLRAEGTPMVASGDAVDLSLARWRGPGNRGGKGRPRAAPTVFD
jgi:hypothetical protein